MKYLHKYELESEFNDEYWGEAYIEPWVSLTSDIDRVDYNKKPSQGVAQKMKTRARQLESLSYFNPTGTTQMYNYTFDCYRDSLFGPVTNVLVDYFTVHDVIVSTGDTVHLRINNVFVGKGSPTGYTPNEDEDFNYYVNYTEEPLKYFTDNFIEDYADQVFNYLTFDVESGGTIYWVSPGDSSQTGNTKTIQYSINGGEWQSITSSLSGSPIEVSTGDSVRLKGNNSSYSNTAAMFYNGNTAYSNHFGGSTTLAVSASGNIMSLVGGDDFSELDEVSAYAFSGLFYRFSSLKSVQHLVLPATKLRTQCYYNMFCGIDLYKYGPMLPMEITGLTPDMSYNPAQTNILPGYCTCMLGHDAARSGTNCNIIQQTYAVQIKTKTATSETGVRIGLTGRSGGNTGTTTIVNRLPDIGNVGDVVTVQIIIEKKKG